MNGAIKRYCVVTPYYKEDRALMTRCLDSVRRQTVAVDHIVVADGFPQDWLDERPVRHIKLDRAHADYGNFARGVGALMAVAEKYDGVCFLDADNWYDDDHVEQCLNAAARHPGSPYIAARRRFVRPDGTVLIGLAPAEYPEHEHVDTNSMFLLPPTYQHLHRWCTIPQELSASGDHLFYLIITVSGIAPVSVPQATVNYQCMFEPLYRERGEEPPPGAKPILHWGSRQAWINTLSHDELMHLRTLVGLQLRQFPVGDGEEAA